MGNSPPPKKATKSGSINNSQVKHSTFPSKESSPARTSASPVPASGRLSAGQFPSLIIPITAEAAPQAGFIYRQSRIYDYRPGRARGRKKSRRPYNAAGTGARDRGRMGNLTGHSSPPDFPAAMKDTLPRPGMNADSRGIKIFMKTRGRANGGRTCAPNSGIHDSAGGVGRVRRVEGWLGWMEGLVGDWDFEGGGWAWC